MINQLCLQYQRNFRELFPRYDFEWACDIDIERINDYDLKSWRIALKQATDTGKSEVEVNSIQWLIANNEAHGVTGKAVTPLLLLDNKLGSYRYYY